MHPPHAVQTLLNTAIVCFNSACFFFKQLDQDYHLCQDDGESSKSCLGQRGMVVSRYLDALAHVMDNQLRHELRRQSSQVRYYIEYRR